MTRRYVETVEAKGWSLYDISLDLRRGWVRGWNDLAEQGTATQVLDGGTYILAPRPQPGQTLRDAYRVYGGLGPCLRIADPNSPEYTGLLLCHSPRMALFTRVAMQAAGVELYSFMPPGMQADRVLLNSATAEETFARDFNIITREQYDSEVARTRREFRPGQEQ